MSFNPAVQPKFDKRAFRVTLAIWLDHGRIVEPLSACHDRDMSETETRCPRCGTTFTCKPGKDCWCMTPPYIPMPSGDEACLCPACLERARAAANRPPAAS
jgi:hypothetical protein